MRCYVFLILVFFMRCHYNTLNSDRLTGLTCSEVPGLWMVARTSICYITYDFLCLLMFYFYYCYMFDQSSLMDTQIVSYYIV